MPEQLSIRHKLHYQQKTLLRLYDLVKVDDVSMTSCTQNFDLIFDSIDIVSFYFGFVDHLYSYFFIRWPVHSHIDFTECSLAYVFTFITPKIPRI